MTLTRSAHKGLVVAGTILTAILAGCRMPTGAMTLAEVEAASGFSAPLRVLGMVPVMPPREDVRVGDVYLASSVAGIGSLLTRASAKGARLPLGTRWGVLNVFEELENEYKQRRPWPKTPDSYLQISKDPLARSIEEPIAEGDGSVFSPQQRPNRLRVSTRCYWRS